MNHTSARPRTARSPIALVVATLVAFGSLLGATPALAVAGPTLTVTTAPAAGGIATVTGSGFTSASPGVYVAVGAAGAAGFYSASGSDTVWVAPGNADGSSGMGRTAPMTADGTFTITLTVPAPSESVPAYAVYSSKAHGQGMADTSQNAISAVTFAAAPDPDPEPEPEPEPEPVVPAVTVSKTSGLDPEGETVTVTGTGFAAAAHPTAVGTRPPLAGQFSGFYVGFGSYADVWKPSEGAASSARVNSSTKWLVKPEHVAVIGGTAAGGIALADNGSFSIELTVKEFEAALADGNYGIYTYGGGGVKYAPFETYTPLTFAQPEVVVTPVPAPAPAVPVAAGSLTWGVKLSFRSYITGPIAHGSITTTGARTSGGLFIFGQASGGTFTAESGTGTSNYSGSVRFTGHSGALDVTLANPVVTVNSASSGTLSVTSNGSRVTVATLKLAAASKSVSNGAVTYTAVPATLTAAGVPAFSDFYAAGTALDPVSFTIGSASSTGGATTVIASYAKTASAPPATPPATTGITVETPASGIIRGGPVTITADGFQPDETGITVVIYSEPTVLDHNATADANGRVIWTGTLPDGLTGTHTLTLQGSVDRGVVIEIPEVQLATLDSCEVDGAELVWGFKEAFRGYISGTIARGEWTVSDGAAYETPSFTFSGGNGSFDGATGAGDLSFAGAITFTGHGGVLNTTVSNPRIELVDESTGVLVLDVSGTTQEGATVDQAGVRFAELDLAAGTRTDDDGRVVFTAVPASLTEAGSEAFGTYEAGTEFDPVTFSFAADPDCAVAATDAPAVVAEPADEPQDLLWIAWVAIVLLLAVAAVLTTMIVLRRRRA